MGKKLKDLYKEQTRAAIINAAREMFNKYGYENSTLDEVAELAGLSKAALYNYFKNKETLFVSMMQETFDDLIDELCRALEKSDDPIEQCRMLFQTQIEQAQKMLPITITNVAYVMTQLDVKEMKQRFRGLVQKLYDQIYRVIENGKEKGSISKKHDSGHLVILILTLLSGAGKMRMVFGMEPDQVYCDSVIDVFFHGVKGDKNNDT